MNKRKALSAGVTAAVLVALALAPPTRDALRSDARIASGERPFTKTLTDLGLKEEDLPWSGFVNPPSFGQKAAPPAPDASLEERLASATRLKSPEKWVALQKLVIDFPSEPAAHAALARFACKNGGSVGIGHPDEQDKLSAKPRQTPYVPNPSKPEDIALMTASCEAGEQLDPENGYFPAMAAVAYLSADRAADARAALHRAAQKTVWREYIDAELRGQERLAEKSGAAGNTITRTARMASIAFPQYAQLRALSRLMIARAVEAEPGAPSIPAREIRRDVWKLGALMRTEGTSLICNLVGMAMTRIAAARPAGAPALGSEEDKDHALADARFVQYLQFLATVDSQAGNRYAEEWPKEVEAQKQVRAVSHMGMSHSAFSFNTGFETVARSFVNGVLFAGVALLCVLAALFGLTPTLGRRFGKVGVGAAILGGALFAGWLVWNALAMTRELMAYQAMMQGLAGDEGSTTEDASRLMSVFLREATLCGLALFVPGLTLIISAILAKHGQRSRSLRDTALTLSAILALVYAIHLTSFALRERTVSGELTKMAAHEGRYVAEKCGLAWPGNDPQPQ